MNTPKPSLLTVTLPNAPIPLPEIKTAKLIKEDGFPYWSISYSLEGKTQNEFTYSEVATALAGLISPMRELTVKELEQYPILKGYLISQEIESSEVVRFLNTYGQVGLADSSRRTQFKFGRTFLQKEVENFCSEVGIFVPKEIAKTVAYFKKNPSEFGKRVLRIAWGTEVPYKWIMELLANKKEQSFKLEQSPELRRLMYASDRAPFVIPFGKDSGTYRPLDEKWKISDSGKENLVDNFTSNVNRFLRPLTYYAIQTEKSREERKRLNSLETFLVYSICTTEGGFKEKFCLKDSCRRPFYGQRISKKFCSDSCSSSMRQKRAREKKKVSVQKNRKKTNSKKGKNG
jgi:hypothetical protein